MAPYLMKGNANEQGGKMASVHRFVTWVMFPMSPLTEA